MCPRVKQLHNLCPRIYLVADIVSYVASQMAEQCMQHGRVLHHHGLGLCAVPARPLTPLYSLVET